MRLEQGATTHTGGMTERATNRSLLSTIAMVRAKTFQTYKFLIQTAPDHKEQQAHPQNKHSNPNSNGIPPRPKKSANDFIISSKAKKNGIKNADDLKVVLSLIFKKQLYINNNAMKKKYNDIFQENVQLKTKLSQMKKEIDKLDKLIKQGSKNYQKNANNDFQDVVEEDDHQGPSLKNLWHQKKMIKELKEEIEGIEAQIKDTKHDIQSYKSAQAEGSLALLTRNLEHYNSKIQRLEEQKEKEADIVEENQKLRREEVELAKKNNELIMERDALKQEIKELEM